MEEFIKMISDELRNKIEPYLQEMLPEEEWQYMDYCFKETYLTNNEMGMDVIAVQPTPDDNTGEALLFSIETGQCAGIMYWSVAQQRGIPQ